VRFDTLNDYSLITGMGIRVVDADGAELFATSQFEIVRKALSYLDGVFGSQESSLEVEARSRDLALVMGGGFYVYLCPRGLMFGIVPFARSGRCQRFVIGGPLILSNIYDYVDFEIIPQAASGIDRYEALRWVSCIPVKDPRIASAVFEHLFVSTAFINGTNTQLVSLLDGEDIYSDDDPYDKAAGIEKLRFETHLYDNESEVVAQKTLLETLWVSEDIQIRSLFNEIKGQILFHPRNNLDLLKAKSMDLISVLAESAMHNGAETKILLQMRNRALLEIDELESLDEIVVWLNKIYELFTSHVFNNPNSRYTEAIRKSLAFMMDHYQDKITLNDVAAHVSFSPTYLSSLFKNEVGQTFKSCLNRIRIEQSKLLISDWNLTIAEVSCQVGFTDQSYFAKVFKQYEGVTPYLYRLTCKQ
jgi:AraC-like DNA-binding protein